MESIPPPPRVFLSLFLCVYMVRACEYVYGCLRPTMFTGGQRKSEKDICIFLYLYPITLNEGLLLNWKLTVLAGLLPSVLLWFVCLCPCTNLNVGVKDLWRHACLFIWVLGIKLRSLCLHKQVLLPIFWAIFLASEMRLKSRNCLFCYVWVFCLHVFFAPHVCSAHWGRKKAPDPWNCSFRWLCVLSGYRELNSGSAARVANTLNLWTITPVIENGFFWWWLFLSAFYYWSCYNMDFKCLQRPMCWNLDAHPMTQLVSVGTGNGTLWKKVRILELMPLNGILTPKLFLSLFDSWPSSGRWIFSTMCSYHATMGPKQQTKCPWA